MFYWYTCPRGHVLTETLQNAVEVQHPVDVCSNGAIGATVVFTNTIPSVVVVTAGVNLWLHNFINMSQG